MLRLFLSIMVRGGCWSLGLLESASSMARTAPGWGPVVGSGVDVDFERLGVGILELEIEIV